MAEAAVRAPAEGRAERWKQLGQQALERLSDWQPRLPGFKRPLKSSEQLGLALLPEGIALASVQRVAGTRPRITRCEFIPLPRQADPGLSLRNQMLQAGQQRAAYRLVLNPDEYQLHLVESPDVPDAELREAVRWRIRDLIDFPVNEAAIDVFDIPRQAGASREAGKIKMMNVVVARTPVIAQKAGLIARSGGELDVIDIPDLTLRNLMALTPADAKGVALLYVESTFSLILITAESTLYLSRRIFFGQRELAALAGRDEQDEEFRRVAGALAMELLRSLEYYESHFARPPVDALYIAPLGAGDEPLRRHLGKTLGVEAQDLDLNSLLDIPAKLSPELQARSLLALGAALRFERAAL